MLNNKCREKNIRSSLKVNIEKIRTFFFSKTKHDLFVIYVVIFSPFFFKKEKKNQIT